MLALLLLLLVLHSASSDPSKSEDAVMECGVLLADSDHTYGKSHEIRLRISRETDGSLSLSTEEIDTFVSEHHIQPTDEATIAIKKHCEQQFEAHEFVEIEMSGTSDGRTGAVIVPRRMAELHNYYLAAPNATLLPPASASDFEYLMNAIGDQRGDAPAGSLHYRTYVGPAFVYDEQGATQFNLLFSAGLRGRDRVLEVGCGSLRLGRLLIPYLAPGRYHCLEPNAWLYETGLRFELGGGGILHAKAPTFHTNADFEVAPLLGGDEEEEELFFDWAIAYSVFSHTEYALLRRALDNIAPSLGGAGVLLASFVLCDPAFPHVKRARDANFPGGWAYPDLVCFEREELSALIGLLELEAVELGRHARGEEGLSESDRIVGYQTWFAVGRDIDVLCQVVRRTGGSFEKEGREISRHFTKAC